MSAHRPFRFGLNAIRSGSAVAWRETARRAEALGYATLAVADHIGTELAPLVALAAAADVTTTLRVGSYVFGTDFWHPALLAREAATIDLLSGGRLELGIGTGWEQEDYIRRGIPRDPPGVQVSRFAEALQVIKGLFGVESLTFAGAHYTIDGYNCLPKPAQRPHPPIMIGAGGRRMLSLAVAEADIISVNPSGLAERAGGAAMAAEAMEQKVAWLSQWAGGRLAEIELNTLVLAVRVTEDRRGAAEQLAREWAAYIDGLSADVLLESPYFLFGSVEQIIEQVQQRRERYGVSYLTLYGEEYIDIFAPVVAQLAGS